MTVSCKNLAWTNKTQENWSRRRNKKLRKQIIRARKRERNRVQISEEIGLSYVAVCNIVKRYRAREDKGISALAPARRGRREGESRQASDSYALFSQHLMCWSR
ncbi:hypothetical protein BI364_10280 [Acidihalobacter yilgarnensis]|uniref:Uncharacterized protein n=1 Tax=Acidihalobacter yilgarnensis TaxID=2819280 RepID=A0A1D8IPA2_9GAMM|nr:hypothetical protein BI364_10280 [Acidihalobacter yilgarnensis]